MALQLSHSDLEEHGQQERLHGPPCAAPNTPGKDQVSHWRTTLPVFVGFAVRFAYSAS
jgi:hypothetical protein